MLIPVGIPAQAAPVLTSFGGELLSNGGIESSEGTAPWTRLDGRTNMVVITGNAHDGAHYLRANTGSAGADASVSQDVPYDSVAGESFTGSVWVRSDTTNGSLRLALWGVGGGGTEGNTTTVAVTSQWQQVQVSLDTTTSHTVLRLEMYMESTDVQYAFDGASLMSQCLAESSFEQGTVGSWNTLTAGTNRAIITGTGHDGTHYLRANTGSAGSGASVSQDVQYSSAAGDSLVATVWVRSESTSTGSGRFVLWGLGGGGSEGGTTAFTATSQWQQIQVPLDSTTSHILYRFQVYMDSPGIQYAFDGATLVAQSLKNASYENGTVLNWDRLTSGTNAVIITGNAHDGSRYMRANTGSAGANASVNQDFSYQLAGGKSLTATIWVRSDAGTGTARLVLWGLGGDATEGSTTAFTTTSQWQQVQVSLDTTT
ncbi:MAG: hypothetical protein L6367_09470, partial [Cellulomonas sp.]|nr:hypothetical protein [Cellulomonas sp.]